MEGPRTDDTGGSSRLNSQQLSSPPSSRSSKRANSAASVFERSKFRSKVETFSMYTTAAVAADKLHDAQGQAHPLENKGSTNLTGSASHSQVGPRHYSASSVINGHTFVGKSLFSPLSPQMEHLWASNTLSEEFPIKLIDQKLFKTIVNWHYSNPVPECDSVFPWLHGIHHSNQNQKAFFACLMDFTTVERNNFSAFENQTKIPSGSRGLMTVRSAPIRDANGLSEFSQDSGLLKGSVEPEEILCPLDVSNEELLIFLTNLLKELKIEDVQPEKTEMILGTLFSDCGETGLLPIFKDIDPQKGISLRNFHIQVTKMAQISDFVVYCFNDDHVNQSPEGCCACASVSRLLYFAQLKHSIDHSELVDQLFQTVILENNGIEFFREAGNESLLIMDKVPVQDTTRDLDKCCSKFDIENYKNWDSNYLLREKLEISKMSSATPISETVWLGNTTDYETHIIQHEFNIAAPARRRNSSTPLYIDPANSTVVLTRQDLEAGGEDLLVNKSTEDWSVCINCSDGASFPDNEQLSDLITTKDDISGVQVRFPPSGSVGIGDCTDADMISLVNTCKLIYTKGSSDHPSLIFCADGYTESSLLGVCYLIYSTGKTFTEVCLDLHNKHGRPFFLFPTDVRLITIIESILHHYSPLNLNNFDSHHPEQLDYKVINGNIFQIKDKTWLAKLDASLPSRVLPHLYLGSLNHANSFEMLQALNIKHVVSVGESLSWMTDQDEATVRVLNTNITIMNNFKDIPVESLMYVDNIQDDGIDMLAHTLDDILNFINDVYEKGEKVLVHCRVGVSRSATVCIAEVMKRLKVNLIRAYIYVRVRRLNIIIQPNLRFMYELVKYEEIQRTKKLRLQADSENSTVELKAVNLSKRLSESVSSVNSLLSCDISEISTNLQMLDAASSPVQHSIDSAVVDDDDDDDNDDDEGQHEFTGEGWLRDVDWHVLCREIDILNKAYIRS